MHIKDLYGRTGGIYLRKSRAEELTDTTDEVLKRHRETLTAYAAKYNLVIDPVDIFEEVVSGESIYMRPRMCRLLEEVNSEKYKFVLVMDIDRLGRGGMKDQGIILETFKDSRTVIVTPRRIYDLENEQDEEETENEAFFARKELKKIKRRLNDGKIKTTEEGGHLANPPYGYKRAWVNKIPTLEIVPEEANFVRMIFDMYVNQGAGCSIIADTLNSLGAKPHKSSLWSRNSVRTILQNPVYTGKIVRNKKKIIRKGQNGNAKNTYMQNPKESWLIADGIHEPIIDVDTFNNAGEIRLGRYKPGCRKVDTLENPLAGIITCKNCGSNMQRRKFKKKENSLWLLCPSKGCIKSSRFDRIENSLLEVLQLDFDRFDFSKDTESRKKELELIYESIKYIKNEIVKNEKQTEKLYDLLEQGIYTIEIYKQRFSILSQKVDSLNSSLKEMISKTIQMETEPALTFNNPATVYDLYSSMNNTAKNNFLKNFIDKVVYFKDKSWKPDQFELTVYIKDYK